MCQLRSGPISAQGIWLAHHRESHGPAAPDLPRFSLPIVIWKVPSHSTGPLSHPAGAACSSLVLPLGLLPNLTAGFTGFVSAITGRCGFLCGRNVGDSPAERSSPFPQPRRDGGF